MNNLYKNINDYYTSKVKNYGATPQGVDWNGEKSQFLRFKQISKIIESNDFKVADLGCGYGKYFEYLSNNFSYFDYVGYDLSKRMIKEAKKEYKGTHAIFKRLRPGENIEKADYVIASGIFSVKLESSESEWLSYILKTLDVMNKKSIKGFSFNMLTKYSEQKFMKNNLYYADPLFIFDYCKRNFSKNIALLHDYDLYEFTVLVRK